MKPTLQNFLIGLAASCFWGLAGISQLPAQSFGPDSGDSDEIPVQLETVELESIGAVSVETPAQAKQDKKKKRPSAGAGMGSPGGLSGGAGLGGLQGGGLGGQRQGRPARGGAQGVVGLGGLEEEDYYQEKEGADGGGLGMGLPKSPGPRQVTLVLKMYQVGDLLNQPTDVPFAGFVLPGISTESNLPARSRWNGGGGFGGGGTGGGGFGAGPGMDGGGGGGYTASSSGEVTIYELIGAIEQTIAAPSWANRGGVGSISKLGDIMIVNQTEQVHEQIDTFIQMLRSNQTKRSTVTLKAVWLSLNEEQFQSLDIEADQQVNSKVLAELVKSHGQRGQVTCFDGQTTHLAAGNLKSTIESVVPVVGQLDLIQREPTRLVKKLPLPISKPKPTPTHVMAQGLGGLGGGASSFQENRSKSVGYQPVSRWINYGAVVQMTPKVDADQKMLTLQVTSFLVSSGNEKQPVPSQISADYEINQHDLRCQQFRSNVRLKASTPTLVGGAAFQSSVGEEQTYLVIEAIVNND